MTTKPNTDQHAFLQNPQQCGAWCLRIKFPDESHGGFSDLLNIDSWALNPRRFRRAYYEEISEITPVFLIRLFVYLRAALPRKITENFPDMAPSLETEQRRRPVPWIRRRNVNFEIREICRPPTRLSPAKRTQLTAAAKEYLTFFPHFVCAGVSDEPGKVDFRDHLNGKYFQATQEPQGVLKILAVEEQVIVRLRALFDALPGVTLAFEQLRVFSPESMLMSLYVPTTRLLNPADLLSDISTIKNCTQILDEIREERFVHAVRATGIAVEELLVEIYETYTHEKAPSSPLGELLSGLQLKLKELITGNKVKDEMNCAAVRKQFGQIIQNEKKKPVPDGALLSVVEVLQKSILPLLEQTSEAVLENGKIVQRETKVALFPLYLQRCIGELVSLRNRVSHRTEKATSVTNVGYLESAIALRAFLILAMWWQAERSAINYKQSRRNIVIETTRRSALLNSEREIFDCETPS